MHDTSLGRDGWLVAARLMPPRLKSANRLVWQELVRQDLRLVGRAITICAGKAAASHHQRGEYLVQSGPHNVFDRGGYGVTNALGSGSGRQVQTGLPWAARRHHDR